MRSVGKFSGQPVTEWCDGDLYMKLLEDFWYDDPKGLRWIAPKGSRIDGATIPSALWNTIGSPFVGPYRRASVVHDVACRDALAKGPEARKQADAMFYFACLAGGCSTAQARIMYTGVRIGAWSFPASSAQDAFCAAEVDVLLLPSVASFEELEASVERCLLTAVEN